MQLYFFISIYLFDLQIFFISLNKPKAVIWIFWHVGFKGFNGEVRAWERGLMKHIWIAIIKPYMGFWEA